MRKSNGLVRLTPLVTSSRLPKLGNWPLVVTGEVPCGKTVPLFSVDRQLKCPDSGVYISTGCAILWLVFVMMNCLVDVRGGVVSSQSGWPMRRPS
jgi:hypothetical protein